MALQFNQFNSASGHDRVVAEEGIIYGVCVMRVGEAKGHGVMLDDGSLESFLRLTVGRPDGVGVRFGADHRAGAEDFNGTLRNFRKVNGMIKADLHLLKSDLNFSKLIEMAQKMPNEFGLSASTDAEKVIVKGEEQFKDPIRFTELFCVDVVTNPAATNGLFFAQPTKQNSMKKLALSLGLPETATMEEIEAAAALAFDCKKKMDAEAAAKKKKLDADADADADADDESCKTKESHKKLAALETAVLNLSTQLESIASNTKAAAESAKKAEIEGLKLEASRDGKVIPLEDTELLTLSIPAIKGMISKLPKGQIKLSRGMITPVAADGKPITNRRSPEYRDYISQKRKEGAIALGNRILAQQNGLNLSN